MKSLFYLLLALSLITGVVMFYHIQNMNNSIEFTRDRFDILKFELPCNKDSLDTHITRWTNPAYPARKKFVINQFHVDYIFMSVLFPCVSLWCFRSRSNLQKVKDGKLDHFLIKLLAILGVLQLLAWVFDFYENWQLLQWIHSGKAGEIGFFKTLVISKFIIVISGILTAILGGSRACNKLFKNI